MTNKINKIRNRQLNDKCLIKQWKDKKEQLLSRQLVWSSEQRKLSKQVIVGKRQGFTSVMKLLSCCLALNLLTFWCILLSFSSSSRSAQRQWRYELGHKKQRSTEWISHTSMLVLIDFTTTSHWSSSYTGVKNVKNTLVDGSWILSIIGHQYKECAL